MKVKPHHQQAAARALEQSGAEPDDVERVVVDGVEIDPAQLTEGAPTAPDGERPGLVSRAIHRVMDKIEPQVDRMEETLQKYRPGRYVARVLEENDERVERTTDVVLTLRGGRVLKVPVTFLDVQLSMRLQRVSSSVAVAALLPLIGPAIPAATGALAAIGAALARPLGHGALEDALKGMAKKHLVLAGANLLPIVGNAASILSAVLDERDRRELSAGAPVGDVVTLADHGPATLKADDADAPPLATQRGAELRGQ